MNNYYWIEEICCDGKALAEGTEIVEVQNERIGDTYDRKGDADLALVKYLGFDRDLEAKEADGTIVVGYAIHESEPDPEGGRTCWGNVRCWSFDRKGYPIMDSCTDERDTQPFHGRTKDDCPFEPGDKVLVYSPGEFCLEVGLVKAVPPTAKFVTAFEKMTGKQLVADDDYFIVAYPDKRTDCPYPPYLFPMPEIK